MRLIYERHATGALVPRASGDGDVVHQSFHWPPASIAVARRSLLNRLAAQCPVCAVRGVRGRLVGDWFHTSIANDGSSVTAGPVGWPKTLAFAYDWFAGQPRISVGGTLAEAGVLRIASTDPDPTTVSAASGLVAYQGTPVMGRIPAGWMLVQLLTDERIRAEYFAGATTRPTEFTGAAQEYVR